jgi:hypothetical protein
MKHIRIFSAVLFVVLLASCKQASNSDPTVGMWTISGAGTVLMYQSTQQGSNVLGYDTMTILNTGQSIGGKTNVFYLGSMGRPGYLFYDIEANGDISMADTTVPGLPGSLPTLPWLTFPSGSHVPIFDPSLDTLEGAYRYTDTSVRTFIGIENITVPAGSFSTIHVRETDRNFVTRTDSLNPSIDSTIENMDFWFAPSLGFYVKQTYNLLNTDGYDRITQSEVDLIKYIPH